MKVHTWIAALLLGAGGAMAAPARAAPIEGRLSFPGGFLPAMTVYARDLDGARLHSVATAESQATFKLDLPPGRYVFFAEPRQAGAPQLYGAFTQAVACRLRDLQPCDDHALVAVDLKASIGAGADHTPSAAPLIADWSLPDELAAQFDQLLGHSGETSVQELGAPRFSEYPARAEITTPHAPDFSLLNASVERQQQLREALPAAPNFAGNVVVAQLACAPNCLDVIVFDWKSGKLQAPPALAQVAQDLPCRGAESIVYRRDSRLLSLTRRRNAGIVTQYFLWKPDTGALQQTAEYQRSVERFCALQTP